MSDFLILGSGYTGKYLESDLQKIDGARVFKTSRSRPDSIRFDLQDQQTWKNIPLVSYTFWLFPAEPIQTVEKFFLATKDRLGKLVVVSTTGAFIPEDVDGIVNEKSKIDSSMERVNGENFLLSEGASIVHAAGIYGPNRSPLEWVKHGRIGMNSKIINLIHVEDLSQILIKAALHPQTGSRYIASDLDPQPWNIWITQWQKMGLLGEVPPSTPQRISKKVDSSVSLKFLQVSLKYKNVIEGVSKNC